LKTCTALILDSYQPVLESLALALSSDAWSIRTAQQPRGILSQLDGVDLLLADLPLPEERGMWFLRKVLAARPDRDVIMMSSCGSLHLCLEVLSLGARACLVKPLCYHELAAHLDTVYNDHLQRQAALN
jgi:DNA-binding response OmpR family regulator